MFSNSYPVIWYQGGVAMKAEKKVVLINSSSSRQVEKKVWLRPVVTHLKISNTLSGEPANFEDPEKAAGPIS